MSLLESRKQYIHKKNISNKISEEYIDISKVLKNYETFASESNYLEFLTISETSYLRNIFYKKVGGFQYSQDETVVS